MTHAHVSASRSYVDGHLDIDGQPFPYPIHSIAWRLDIETALPVLTVAFEVDRLTIDHGSEEDA